ncbi:MAG: hypothetical protein ACI9WU_003559, partial [Myxococcota bacterium]
GSKAAHNSRLVAWQALPGKWKWIMARVGLGIAPQVTDESDSEFAKRRAMEVGAGAGCSGALNRSVLRADRRVEAVVLQRVSDLTWGTAQAASCGSLLRPSLGWRSCARGARGQSLAATAPDWWVSSPLVSAKAPERWPPRTRVSGLLAPRNQPRMSLNKRANF